MKTKIFTFLAVFNLLIVPMFVCALPAMAGDLEIGLEYAENLGLADTDEDPRDVVVSVIRFLMTFLGLIAVAVILLGGFRWLTSAGNEDKISKAKKTIIAGVVGLIVVLAAFAIVQFVVNTTSNMISSGNP